MSIEILANDSEIKAICTLIENNGYRAYLVGGCVRDALMGLHSSDIDITTSALPDDICRIFENHGYKTIRTGFLHGTVSVISKTRTFEITTMRREDRYEDSRHPSDICFVDCIEQDLCRRDFTINAIAYSYSENKVIDLFDGIRDINNRVIRCVGEPVIRFSEDALRILRAIRFSSVLCFSIDESTSEAIFKCKNRLLCISSERVKRELDKILLGNGAGKILYDYSDVIGVIVEEINKCKGFDQHSKYHVYDVLMHICAVIDNTPKKLSVRYAALFHDIAKPNTFFLDANGEGHFHGHAAESAVIASETMKKLKFDKKTYDAVYTLIKHHDTPLPTEVDLIKRRLRKHGNEIFFDLVDLAVADCLAQSSDLRYRLEIYEQIKKTAQSVIDSCDCVDRIDLKINGHDLIALGFKGNDIGKALEFLLDGVITGKLNNDRDQLLCAVRSYMDDIDIL